MNHPDMQKFDPSPKRRKIKDNPYTLFTVGLKNGEPHFYVSFKAANGNNVCIEVEKEIYEAMNRFELDDLSYLNEMDNHYERSELTEAALTKRAQKKAESVDALVLEKLQNENLKETVLRLPEIQRRRVVLYYYGGFTCKQIAEQENCSVIAVKKTLDAARKNLKKLLE